ncbi:MAG: nucleotidyltransferase domain-containing protein, partial [Acidihalobacter sp.]
MTDRADIEHIEWPATLESHFDLEAGLGRLAQAEDKLAAGRDLLDAATEALGEAFTAGVLADDLVHGRAAVLDRLLHIYWRDVGLNIDRELALVAVGGYGRGELLPGSDIDLLLLAAAAPDEPRGEQISEFIRRLWDMGLHVGHSVRTIDDCVREAAQDITVITNLIEAR